MNVYSYSDGVLGVDLTEVPTMLSQGDDFTQLTTDALHNMVCLLFLCFSR